jgi:hypothetical protein
MPGPGGKTTLSGIHFQVEVTVLYLGRMIDPTPRGKNEQVVEVRQEADAEAEVDDILVRYEDGHTDFIQVKESLSNHSQAWTTMWGHFEDQRWREDFENTDKLILALGQHHAWSKNLAEATSRARGAKNSQEWLAENNLSRAQHKLVESIRKILEAPNQSDERLFGLLQSVWVSMYDADQVRELDGPKWMPVSTLSPLDLFDKLRSIALKAGEIGMPLDRPELLARLKNENVEIKSGDWAGGAGPGLQKVGPERNLRLHQIAPPDTGIVHHSSTGFLSLGRDPANDVVFPPDTKGISWSHGTVLLEGDRYIYRHLSGSQTTVLLRRDGSSLLLAPGMDTEAPLQNHDRLRLGEYEFAVTFDIIIPDGPIYTHTEGGPLDDLIKNG